jgi:hypothetical protein
LAEVIGGGPKRRRAALGAALQMQTEQERNMMYVLGQLPAPATGEIEKWLISAAAVVSLVALGKKLFVRKPPIEAEFVTKAEFRLFRESVEREINGLRDRLDVRFLNLAEKIEQMKSELLSAGERRGSSIHRRINEMEAGLARVDERTRH